MTGRIRGKVGGLVPFKPLWVPSVCALSARSSEMPLNMNKREFRLIKSPGPLARLRDQARKESCGSMVVDYTYHQKDIRGYALGVVEPNLFGTFLQGSLLQTSVCSGRIFIPMKKVLHRLLTRGWGIPYGETGRAIHRSIPPVVIPMGGLRFRLAGPKERKGWVLSTPLNFTNILYSGESLKQKLLTEYVRRSYFLGGFITPCID